MSSNAPVPEPAQRGPARLPPRSVDVAVVILTLNEEQNLPQALASLGEWPRLVLVVDSHSVDGTVDIATASGCTVVRRKFDDYASQRNFALDQVPSDIGWVLFLDADEWLTEGLRDEIAETIARRPPEAGFFINRRLIWMGRWVRRGYYPTWILRLVRRDQGRWEPRSVNEHLCVEGPVGYLRNDLVHEDRKGVFDWVAKHNRYAVMEAREMLREMAADAQVPPLRQAWSTQAGKKRWIKMRVWNRLPPIVRPILYFMYRYFLRGGFLDGRAGLCYHLLQGFWYQLLIDINYLEMSRDRRDDGRDGPAGD